MTSKQLEEERSRQRDLKKKVDEVEEEKGLTNQQYEAKIAQVQEDMEDLKSRLVVVTRYDRFQSFCGVLSNRGQAQENMLLLLSAGKHVFATKRGENETVAKRGKTCNCHQAQPNVGKQVTAAKRGKTQT